MRYLEGVTRHHVLELAKSECVQGEEITFRLFVIKPEARS